MLGLTKLRRSPRDPDDFPTFQLLLLGELSLQILALLSRELQTNVCCSPCPSRRAHCSYFHLSVCHQPRCTLWHSSIPRPVLRRHPYLCLLPRRSLHGHVLGRFERQIRAKAHSYRRLLRHHLFSTHRRVRIEFLDCSCWPHRWRSVEWQCRCDSNHGG